MKKILKLILIFIHPFFSLKQLNFLFVLFFVMLLHAQSYNPYRYSSRIFSSVSVYNNIQYGAAPQWVWPYWNEDLFMDVYTPVGDSIQNRPLVIFAHAGGFATGSKDVDNIVALCDSFARLGYVAASIDYRKGFNPLDSESAERAVYRGVQDAKAAIRYFKQNHDFFGIDTNYIYFGGMSAGGMMSLYVGYMDIESERPLSTYGGLVVNDLECLDCAGNNSLNSSKVRAVIDCWGGIIDTTMIHFQDTPILIMHGYNDDVVSYYYDHPFSLPTLPLTYGAWPIYNRALNMEMDVELVTSFSSLHMLDGSDNGDFVSGVSPNSFWYDTLLPKTRNFLYKQTKSLLSTAFLDTIYVCPNDTFNLQVSSGDCFYYDWLFDSSNVLFIGNEHNATASFQPLNATINSIGVVGYNSVYCVSDTLWFTIYPFADNINNIETIQLSENSFQFSLDSSDLISVTWTFGDGQTYVGIDCSHTFIQSGEYIVEAECTNTYGCLYSIKDTIVIELSASNATDIEQNKFEIYPNPYKQNSNINLTIAAGSINFENCKIEILTALGNVIYEKTIKDDVDLVHLDDLELPVGIYYVKISSPRLESNNKIIVLK